MQVRAAGEQPRSVADASAAQRADRRQRDPADIAGADLVLHSKADLQVPVDLGRKMAAAIPGVKYIEYPAGDHAFWVGDNEEMLGDIEEFVTGHAITAPTNWSACWRPCCSPISSTPPAARRRWATALAPAAGRSRPDREGTGRQASRQSGKEHRRWDAGDLRWTGPRGALRARFGSAAKQIGLPVRAGLHTGEIEISGNDIGGIAVHAAARVMSHSSPEKSGVARRYRSGAGAGLKFAERGSLRAEGAAGASGICSRRAGERHCEGAKRRKRGNPDGATKSDGAFRMDCFASLAMTVTANPRPRRARWCRARGTP